MTMYFFHNVYGDEKELLDSLPEGVVAVPFGWTEEIEEKRNALLSDLGTSVSSIPCVLVFVPEHFVDASLLTGDPLIPLDHRSVGLQLVPSRWVEISFLGLDKPWSWDPMMALVNSYHRVNT